MAETKEQGSRMRHFFQGHFFQECWRVRWMLVVPVFVLVARSVQFIPDTWPLALILHKPALAAIGFVVAHIGYQQAFPFIDQADLLRNAIHADDKDCRTNFAWLFVGSCVLRGLIYAAFILGVTLGL